MSVSTRNPDRSTRILVELHSHFTLIMDNFDQKSWSFWPRFWSNYALVCSLIVTLFDKHHVRITASSCILVEAFFGYLFWSFWSGSWSNYGLFLFPDHGYFLSGFLILSIRILVELWPFFNPDRGYFRSGFLIILIKILFDIYTFSYLFLDFPKILDFS